MQVTGEAVLGSYLATLPGRPEATLLPSPHGTNLLARLEHPGGRATILKVYRRESAARNEEAALRMLAAVCSEREVPHVLHFGVVNGRRVMEMTCVPGRVPVLEHDAGGHHVVARLGALLRRVHEAGVPGGAWGPLRSSGEPPIASWGAELHGRFHRRIGILQAAGVIDDGTAATAARILADAGPRLAGRTSPDLVHGDLNVSNLLVDDDGAVGLIDFERARGGHWVYDTVKLFSETFGGCPACIEAFTDAYGVTPGAIRDDALVYRLVYSVDMAAYLLGELHTAEDRALLSRLLRFIRHPADPWSGA